MTGKQLRLKRIFAADGRAVIVAMDHANTMGPLPGLERPGELLAQAQAGGADAILTTGGVAARFAERFGRLGLIVRLDGARSTLNGEEAPLSQVLMVEDALRLGADAVGCMGFPGSQQESSTLTYLGRIAAEARAWGVPLMAEMLPRGFAGGADARTAESLALAARIGAELGADFIKTDYSTDPENYGRVIAGCYAPVVVLGGGRVDDPRQVFAVVRAALDLGAAGAAIGRNIWQHPHPDRMTAAIAALVHEDVSIEQALDIVET